MSAAATDAGADAKPDPVARLLAALRISGRRLVETSPGAWAVLTRDDRRARRLMMVDGEIVARLLRDQKLRHTGDGACVLAEGVIVAPPPSTSAFALIAAGRPRRSGEPAKGFLGLAVLARRGAGPLSMRQVKAGLRLIADAEREHNSAGLAMNWSAGPTDRRARGPQRGGQTSAAASASAQLKRVRAFAGEDAWRLAWLACIEGATLAVLKKKTGLSKGAMGAALAQALEQLANAYER
jgi:hypothetical protein